MFAARTIAADKLRVDLTQSGLRARTESAIPIEVRFTWESSHLLEGHLEMELHEGNRILERYHSGDMTLTSGEQKFEMLLPPPLAPFSDQQVEVQMKFVTASGAIELEPAVLFIPNSQERNLLVGWCNGQGITSPQIFGLEQSFFLEQMAPKSEDLARRLTTSLSRLYPEDLPAQPLGYTAYDAVVLTAEAFNEAGERQLNALARWIRGGGSLCVFVAGKLKPGHVEFLNQVADASIEGPVFRADAEGNLLPGQKAVACFRSGLGRSVVVTGNIASDPGLDSQAWRQAVSFLWKIRERLRRGIADTGHWEISTNSPMGDYASVVGQQMRSGQYRQRMVAPPPGNTERFSNYAVRPSMPGTELMGTLMPRTVRLIPLPALVGVMTLFLLMIGPVDYFLLGFLRRRRLTWILFPATSVGFMVATMLMANHYLGLRDQRRSLIVVDLGPDGTALRWNRFEFVFAARDKQVVTELKDALWSPMDIQMAPQVYYPGYGNTSVYVSSGLTINPGYQYNMAFGYNPYFRQPARGETGPPLYEGVVPVHYKIKESLRQWQPELNRTFSFEPPPVPLLPRWRAAEEAWPDLNKVRAKLSSDSPFAGDVCAISTTNSANYSATLDSSSTGILPPPILTQLCQSDGSGLFSVVSQISPSGSGGLEDVTGLDGGEGESALVVVTRAGDDIIVYRRFFHGN